MGNSVTTTQANSVVLGNASTDRAATGQPTAAIDNLTYSFAGVGSAAKGVVSVGSSGNERQIINVASGALNASSTDAVNGSQLFATNRAVGALGTNLDTAGSSVATALGGTSSYNAGTHAVTAGLSLNGNNYTNVQSALTAVNTIANTGWNLRTNGDTASNVGPSGTVQLTNGQNIAITRTGTNVTIGTTAALTATSLTAGVTTVSNTGVSITGGTNGTVSLSNTGLNNGNNKVTNVAAGALNATSTDAVNGSQLFATNTQVTQNTTDIAGNTTAITNLDARTTTVEGNVSNLTQNINSGSVGRVQATGTTNQLALTASGGTGAAPGTAQVLTNVAAGALNATSTQAVNGSQLFATNTQVEQNTTDIAGNTTNIAGNTTAITNLNQSISNGSVGRVQATGTANRLALTASGGTGAAPGAAQVLSNVAAGALNATSTEAVNGSQLFATNTQVDQNTTDIAGNTTAITNLNQNINSGSVGRVQATGTTNQLALTASGGTGAAPGTPQVLTNVAAGALNATSTQAVNGSQLFATNTQVEQNTTDIATNTTNIAGNTTAITNLNQNINSGSVGRVQATGTANQLALTASGGTGAAPGAAQVLTNVAAGALNATSTQAVNGSQLFATNTQVEQNTTDIAGNTTAITNLDARTTTVEGNVSNLTQNINSGSVGRVQATGTTNQLALTASGGTGAAPGAAQVLTNVAAGALNATSTEAVNGSQLFATNTQVDQNTTDIATNTTNIAGNTTAITNLNQNINSGSVGRVQATGTANQLALTASGGTGAAPGAAQVLTNVAAGALNATSTQAVNGSQLFATNTQVTQNTTDIANHTTAITNLNQSITNGAVGRVQATGTANRLALTASGGTGTAPGTAQVLSNVAAGALNATSTEAVNGSQLFATNTQVDQNTTDIATNTTNIAGNTTAITNLDTRMTTVEGDVSNLTQNINSGSVGRVQATGTANQLALTASGGTGAAPGAAQVLTNVAAGALNATSTEAVNGSQLFATNAQVTQNTTDIAGNTTAITNLDTRITTAEGDIVDLGSRIDNVTGDTSAAYVDANGLGLRYARTNETGLTRLDSHATGIGSTALGYGATSSANDSLALGRQSEATVLGSVALGAGSIADRAIAPTSGTIPAGTAVITYNTTDQTLLGSVSVGASGSYRQITQVADGTHAQDAVTIRQLQGLAGSLAATGTRYFHANSTEGDSLAIGDESIAVGPKTVVNGNNGIGMGNGAIVDATAAGGTAIGHNSHAYMTDSIAFGTSSQAQGEQALALGAGAVSQHYLAVALGSGSTTSAAAGTASIVIAGTTYTFAGQTPTSTVSIGSAGLERSLTNLAAGRVAAGSTDAVNGSQLYAATQAIDTIGDRSVTYDGVIGAAKDRITLSGTNGTTIANLADGTVSSTSNEAVNGKQLYNVSQSVADSLGGGATVNANGTITGPNYSVQGNTYTTVSDAVTAVDNSLTSISTAITDINNGAGIKYFHANSAAADSSATGAESVAVGPRALANANNSIAMGNGAVVANNATGGIAIGAGATANNSNDIALGSNSTTDTAVGTSGTTIRGTEYNFAGSAPVGTVSVGSAGNERTVTNVAAGRIAANSTDAVNGSQLHATNEAIEHLSDGLGNMAEGAVMYDRTREGGRMNSITLKGSADVPVTVRNVAAGVADTDVVNVGQLNNSIAAANSYADQVGASVLEQSTSYTDKRINALGFDLSKIRKDANSGIASAMAMSQIPQAFEPGMGMVGMGVSTWQGQQAIAVGLSKAADNGRIVVRASGTYNSRGKGGASAGVGLQF